MIRFTPSRAALVALLALALPVAALAATKISKPTSAEPAAAAPEKAAAKPAAGHGAGAATPALPFLTPPPSYSVDMVITNGKESMTMRRAIDGPRTRTDMEAAGKQFTMIELGDEAGTSYMLMPEEKRAIKQSRAAMKPMMDKMGKDMPEPVAQPAAGQVEKVGQEKKNGVLCDKYVATSEQGVATMWVNPATQQPVRMESAEAAVDFNNFVVGAQPAKLYEPPKGYEVTDMDEMMKKMGDMKGGMSGMMGAGGGLAGVGGVGGGMGLSGGINGMAGNFGQQMGSQMGTQFGTTLGAAFGGPIGAMAGGYVGGKIGGMIGRKTATAITPGK